MTTAKFMQGVYLPENPRKYGARAQAIPSYRSSWELAFMRYLDLDPSILEWDCEAIRIRYFHPIKMKMMTYLPDFFVKKKVGGKAARGFVEIKPRRHIPGFADTESDRDAAAVNRAKWEAARKRCGEMGLVFHVLSEVELFDSVHGLGLTRIGKSAA